MHDRHALNRVKLVLTEGGAARVRLGPADRERAEVSRKRATRWLDRPEVQGFGIGNKRTDGELRNRLSFVVGVSRKRPRGKCPDPVPKTIIVPGVEGPIYTDVLEVGRIRPQHDNDQRHRPAPGGISIGHPAVPYGTLGGLFTRSGEQGVYALSAAHVLADSGLAQAGDLIEQPGRADQTGSRNPQIGSLHSWVPFIYSDEGYPNRIDAAIARVDKSLVRPEILHIGLPGGFSSYIREEMVVRKTGRSTDYTQATVTNADWSDSMLYKHPSGGRRRVGFGNQVLCSRFTEEGDSGALIFNHSDKIIGLHLAGSSKVSVFSRISFALTELGIHPITEPF